MKKTGNTLPGFEGTLNPSSKKDVKTTQPKEIENNVEDIKSGRVTRTLELIADFTDGYAKGWYFAVGEWFKDQLDIKYTNRMEKKKRVMRWTQGKYYCFDAGQVLYDAPTRGLQWCDAVKCFRIACSVVRATPNTINEEKQFIHGQVQFDLHQSRSDGVGLELIGHFQLSQNEFVNFLRTGMLQGHHVTNRLHGREE